jgi:K+-sensing histidine kinase KdpD
VAIRTMRTISTNHWYNRHPALERVLRTARHRLSRAVVVAIAPLMLGSCAELMESPTDITHLRSDLQAHTQLLSQLSAQVDDLERRQAVTESTARRMQQELSQAIEVLLKKALMTENRQTTRESGKSQSKDAETLERQARQPSSETQRASSQGGNSAQVGKHLSLGMTQDDVRRMLGDPISIENAGAYTFWQYSQLSNQKYVVFEKASGQVSGWRGL